MKTLQQRERELHLERRIANLKRAMRWLQNPEDKRRARSMIEQHRREIETINAKVAAQ